MLDRATVVDANFRQALTDKNLPEFPFVEFSSDSISQQQILQIFESQLLSRQLDLRARKLKDQGLGFYTIGSSGHEANAAVAAAFRPTDMAFLHYRSGAFMIERSKQVEGVDPAYDQMLSLVASKDDPISQGRHKVFGSKKLNIPPQTSTIASHLPKALGTAVGLTRGREMQFEMEVPNDSVVLCSFGDASFNHATAQSAFNSTNYLAYQTYPLPLVMICEDNGIGISVPTPKGWVANSIKGKQNISYLSCDGRDLVDVYLTASKAQQIARISHKPVFLHIKTVRLMGHAGSDVESQYKKQRQIEENEAQDPLLYSARLVTDLGLMSHQQVLDLYNQIGEQVEQASEKALATHKLSTAEEVIASLAPEYDALPAPQALDDESREKIFGRQFKHISEPRNLCQNINYALSELMAQHDDILVFGEDVGKKGGVYRVTQDLQNRFGPRRVFDTLLDETTILGTAIGTAQLGFTPFPEIQFLAYTHNAVDQIRGEAATLSFFSSGQYHNPMVIRIAGLAYQKGFGGHFHNDNSLAFLREIPGVIVACPSNGEDAAKMLRECYRLAHEQKRVVMFVEPIALYMTKDLHEKGDNGWLSVYPADDSRISLGEVGSHGSDTPEMVILTYGNGYYLSRQAEEIVKQKHKKNIKVVDLRWLTPLPMTQVLESIKGVQNVLVVDECRKTGSLSEELITRIMEESSEAHRIKRVCGHDTFIPIGKSWEFVLPSTQDIVDAIESF